MKDISKIKGLKSWLNKSLEVTPLRICEFDKNAKLTVKSLLMINPKFPTPHLT